MNYDPYLPADCQGNNPSFPWNQKDLGEPESLGSDCCEASVKEEDGVIRCCECGEACEETFETDEQVAEREEDERASYEEGQAEAKWEASRDEQYC